MALMLSPKILFMDEPTTGVDPVARRALIRTISLMKEPAIMLTTHRMDEVEHLCDKIAIMVKGRFVIYGTPNMLRTKYGRGYQVTIIQKRELYFRELFNIEARMIGSFRDAFCVEGVFKRGNLVEIIFKFTKLGEIGGKYKLSQVFKRLAEFLKAEVIEEFTISRTTLE